MSNQAESLLNVVGDFFAKSHRELSSLLEPLLSRAEDLTFFNFEVAGAEKTRVTAKVKENDIVFTAISDNREFEISIPLSAERAQHATIVMSTMQDGQPNRAALSGADILDASLIPDSFRGLHKKLVEVITQVLPLHALKPFSRGESNEAKASDASSEGQEDRAAQYREIYIEREGLPNLRFNGCLIAFARTYPRGGRSHVFEVYRTQGGKFVGVKRGVSLVLGERTRVEAKVAEAKDELVELFGYSVLAKAIYEQLVLDTDEVIA